VNKDLLVRKANSLVTAKYSLTEFEQKIILTLASLVKAEDDDFKIYYFTISEIANLLQISNSNYKMIIDIVMKLHAKSFIITDDIQMKPYHWLKEAPYNFKTKRFELQLRSSTKPFFLGLKEMYTQYNLKNILSLKSKYAIRIYEILKANEFKTKADVIYTVDYLQDILEKKYDLYSNFKQKVILISQKELAKKTDISFEFEEIKTGRKVTAIKFIIKKNIIKSSEKPIEEKPKQYKKSNTSTPMYKQYNQRSYDKSYFDSLYKIL